MGLLASGIWGYEMLFKPDPSNEKLLSILGEGWQFL